LFISNFYDKFKGGGATGNRYSGPSQGSYGGQTNGTGSYGQSSVPEYRKRDASEDINGNGETKRRRWDDNSSNGPPQSLMNGGGMRPSNGHSNGNAPSYGNDRSNGSSYTNGKFFID